MSVIVGLCKKQIVRRMLQLKGTPQHILDAKGDAAYADCFVSPGETVYISGDNSKLQLFSNESEHYYFYLNHHKVEMTREEVEEHFEIRWERNRVNTCIRDGIPCENLRGFCDGDLPLSKAFDKSCSLEWEVGRADCYKYAVSSK